MRAIFLGLLLSPAAAAPAGMVPTSDAAVEYNEAKARRDRAAADLAAKTKRLEEAAQDAVARAQAGRAVETARKALSAAQDDFDSVVRRMKPGDAIWVQETAVGMTGGIPAAPDRYGLKIPDVGDGVPVDPRSVGLGAGVGEFDLTAKPPPSIGAPGVGEQRAGAPNVPGVTYGLTPGFDNDKLWTGEAMGAGAPKNRDPRRRPPDPEAEVFPPPSEAPPPPEEGVPFSGPLPQALAQVGFVVFPRNETFPTLMSFEAKRPGAGSLKVLGDVSEAVKRGDLAAAAKSAEFLAKRHPDDPGVRRLAAILALRLGRLEEADAHIRAALKLDPMNAEAWTVLAWLRLRQGRRAEAGEAARWALNIDPASAAAAAALKASGAGAGSASGAPAAPPVAAPSPFLSPQTASAEPEAPPQDRHWGALVLGVAAVSGAALAFALKGLVFRRKL